MSVTYKLVYKDGIPEENIIVEKSVSNKIHCASLCTIEDECRGYGFDSEKICSLLDWNLLSETCDSTECTERKGMKIYMSNKEKPTTTVRTLPTESDEEKETTSMEVTTVREVLTTPPEPPDNQVGDGYSNIDGFIETDEYACFNITGEPYCFAAYMPLDCDPKSDDFYRSNETFIRKVKGMGPVTCGERAVVIGIFIRFYIDDIIRIELKCREVNENFVIKSKTTVNLDKETNSVVCPKGAYFNEITTKQIEGDMYDVTVVCREYG